jgi:hypothetical protein
MNLPAAALLLLAAKHLPVLTDAAAASTAAIWVCAEFEDVCMALMLLLAGLLPAQ